MAFDEIGQETDGRKGDDERDKATDGQRHVGHDGNGRTTLQHVFDEAQRLDGARARHRGNGHEEGKFGGGRAGEPQHHRTKNGRARARGAGNERERLKRADAQGGRQRDVLHLLNARSGVLSEFFNQNKGNAVDDQGDGDDDGIVQPAVHILARLRFQYFVQHQTNEGGGNARNEHPAPQPPACFAFVFARTAGKGPQLAPEQHDDGKDGAKLNDHLEHLVKFVHKDGVRGETEGQKILQQNQMPRRADGQPFGNALDDAVDDGLEKFDEG